jgi:hypothetical protein
MATRGRKYNINIERKNIVNPMPRSYSYDLRTRVIKDVNAKMAITEISKI